jgi:RNA polymerase sigma factor (sigma-70 family)
MTNNQYHLYNIENPRAFVRAALTKLNLQLTPTETEDLASEGVAILYELAKTYKPAIGTFSGYATRYLPGRLLRAWHKSNENHYIKTENGTQKWEYGPAALSLDDPDTNLEIPANETNPQTTHTETLLYNQALKHLPPHNKLLAPDVITRTNQGYNNTEIASQLKIKRTVIQKLGENVKYALVQARRELGEPDHLILKDLTQATYVGYGTIINLTTPAT